MENVVIPPKIQGVLQDYEDFLPDKLFGSLPPRRTIGHRCSPVRRLSLKRLKE
ncbi:Hypothetical predicted protein [Prunus dulcis]|uniref:Uncharacterized protein n=1 Tax=Prunus dulcis TaxID=3755 RepID=A0A5E4GGA9_PRUDU|nr:Hypothetical predicted protein [Prunus dulcis]